MKFFGGLTVEEMAEVLRVSPDTVKRDWKLAKAWSDGSSKNQPEQSRWGVRIRSLSGR